MPLSTPLLRQQFFLLLSLHLFSLHKFNNYACKIILIFISLVKHGGYYAISAVLRLFYKLYKQLVFGQRVIHAVAAQKQLVACFGEKWLDINIGVKHFTRTDIFRKAVLFWVVIRFIKGDFAVYYPVKQPVGIVKITGKLIQPAVSAKINSAVAGGTPVYSLSRSVYSGQRCTAARIALGYCAAYLIYGIGKAYMHRLCA